MYKILLTIISLIIFSLQAQNSVRIKDIVEFEGIRENLLIGYGLVVGLNGTGDNLKNSSFTKKSIIDLLEKLGVKTNASELNTKNMAAVMVTAKLPPFARQGSKIDIAVSTMGDAKSLQDGTLLATPLLAADGNVYAVAQGKISVSGFTANGGSNNIVSKNVTTNAHMVNGAIIEKEVISNFKDLTNLKLALHNPDTSTAKFIERAINGYFEEYLALATDPGTVEIKLPPYRQGDMVTILSELEQIEVEVDQKAKIVIDESSGTIVMGENVRIKPVAIAQGNLTVTIKSDPVISQPNSFAPDSASTINTDNVTVKVDEEKGNQMVILNNGTTLRELVYGLNQLGVGPRDLISIINTIKQAGGINATIEVR